MLLILSHHHFAFPWFCHMPCALCGHVGVYLLFVSDIWCSLLGLFVPFVCHLSLTLALCSLPSATCHWLCAVLSGFTFCLRHLVWLVELVCALCLPSVFDICPLLSAFSHMPFAFCGHVGALPSFCLRHLMWLAELVCALGLPSFFDICNLLSAFCHMPCSLCGHVRLYI